MKISTGTKVFLVSICFILSLVGFLVKLPVCFRFVDKGLHSFFYFSAAAFLNLLFTQKKLLRHCFVFLSLLLFGFMIEFAQAFSNKWLHKKIHGRFDIEDIRANVFGLVLFSILWLGMMGWRYLFNKYKSTSTKKPI